MILWLDSDLAEDEELAIQKISGGSCTHAGSKVGLTLLRRDETQIEMKLVKIRLKLLPSAPFIFYFTFKVL